MSELAPGLKHTQSVTVTAEMTPPHLRAEPIRVLATPEMVRLVEQTAIQAVQPLLKPGQTTVGTKVDIAHLAATPEGMKVTIAVEVTGVDRRRLSFRFEVRDEVEKVGEGTHERFIVDPEMRMPRLQAKVDAWRKDDHR
jgi:predicted thioesterase